MIQDSSGCISISYINESIGIDSVRDIHCSGSGYIFIYGQSLNGIGNNKTVFQIEFFNQILFQLHSLINIGTDSELDNSALLCLFQKLNDTHAAYPENFRNILLRHILGIVVPSGFGHQAFFIIIYFHNSFFDKCLKTKQMLTVEV